MSEQPRPSRRHLARALALQALYAWKISAMPMHHIKADLYEVGLFSPEEDGVIPVRLCDVPYFNELVAQIPECVDELEDLIIPHCDRPLDELTPIEHVILWIALYELTRRLEIPPKVVINEAVMLAKEFGVADGYKYINGVLDKTFRKERLSA